jgi:CO/xanthine dehydrogenase FAD-binding subunit
MLIGSHISPELIDSIAAAMALQARPLQLTDFTHSYRKQMIYVYVTRLLEQLTN